MELFFFFPLLLSLAGFPARCAAAAFERTVVFIRVDTDLGQNVFLRGGKSGNCKSDVTSDPCAIPIRHRNHGGHVTSSAAGVWSVGDHHLDWQGPESSQESFHGNPAGGTPLVWTTDEQRAGNPQVAVEGYGFSPLNTFGPNFWMLDVDMDCSHTDQGWFQFKAYVTPLAIGRGWEGDIDQTEACGGNPGDPPALLTRNHMARCGKLNVFYLNSGGCIVDTLPPPSSHHPVCGTIPGGGQAQTKRGLEPRVVGGAPVGEGHWPWMLEILYRGNHGCGAVLISPTWALTAGHCVRTAKTYGPWTTIVRVGETNRHTRSGGERDYFVKNIYKHPNFDRDLPGSASNDYDIALLELLYPVTTGSTDVVPACLPTSHDPDVFAGQECWLTGWGQTQGTGDRMMLQEVRLPVATEASCDGSYGRNVSSRQLCAGGGNKQACDGDSGSPLSCKLQGRWFAAGLVSWGDHGCSGRPSIFTRVSAFSDWIQSLTGLSLSNPIIVG